jgi:hypothetical protein
VVKTDFQLTIKTDGKNIDIICLFYQKKAKLLQMILIYFSSSIALI